MISHTFKNINKYKNKTGVFEQNGVYQTTLSKDIELLDEYLLSEIYQVNNGLIDVKNMPEYVNNLSKLINNAFPHKNIYWYALATSKHFPKEELLKQAKERQNEKLRYALFQRDDLTKRDVKYLMDCIKAPKFRTFLSDKTAYIHPNNIDILCNLSLNDQRVMQYRCFSKINEDCATYWNISEIVQKCKDPELISTALIDNPNISKQFKEKLYRVNGINIEYSNYPPECIMKEIYPSVIETIFNPEFSKNKDVYLKAMETMSRFFENNSLSDTMLYDFLMQISMHDEYKKRPFFGLAHAIQLATDTVTIKKAMEINRSVIIQAIINNKNFPSELLKNIEPIISHTIYKKREMQKLFIISMIDTSNSYKPDDYDECKKYIDAKDEVAIKLMCVHPMLSPKVKTEIQSFINSLSADGERHSYNILMDLRYALKDATIESRQFLMHKFLEYQFEENPVTFQGNEPDFITSDLFLETHNFINSSEMASGGYPIFQTKKGIEKLIKQYKTEGKDVKVLEKLMSYIEGYEKYKDFAKSKNNFLVEKDGKLKMNLNLMYKKFKENKEDFYNDIINFPIETKKIFLQELSKEMCLCESDRFDYKNAELIVNILIDMEGLYQKLDYDIERNTEETKELKEHFNEEER